MIETYKLKIGVLKIALSCVATLCWCLSQAQVPFISSIDKTSGRAQSTITIKGLNFGTNASQIKVWFGGVSVTPTAPISDQLIEVKVPFGASYESIRVENTSTGLSGGSSVQFLPSFGGQNPFDETKLGAQLDFDSESDLYEHALADFDGDGKLDMATANKNSNFISIFRNTSSPGVISFVKTQLNPGVKTIHVAAGDLNGDGMPDVIVTESNGSKVFFYKNTSTIGAISFSQTMTTIAGSKANQIRIEDMDLDGKPDVIITDQASGIARIFALRNQSTMAAIAFAGAQTIVLASTAGTDGIAIADMNGDHLPDIAMGEFLTGNSRIFILRNASVPGAFSFFQSPPIDVSSTVSNFAIGDLDGDQKPDVALTMLFSASVMVLKNQTTGTELQFATPVFFNAGTNPWGIDIGDADGDGKMDIAVASIKTKTVTILNNTSTSGTLSFLTKSKNTTYINRIIKFGDVDNDGRPDLVFTSIDDLVLGIPASKVSIMRNQNCVVPVVTPAGPLTVCTTFMQRLEASNSPGASYEWFKDAVSMGAPSLQSFRDITASGSYTVRLTDTGCSQTSNAVQINVVVAALGPAGINPVSPVCKNGTLALSLASNVGATQYNWTGPGGFTASGLSVNRTNFQPAHAGKYNLDVVVGSCIAEQLSVIVDIVDVPSLTVQMEGADIVCEGSSKTLSFLPEVTGFTYQWAESVSGNISGATNATASVNASGDYLVKLTSTLNGSCPVISSASKHLRLAEAPDVDFSFPAKVCVGIPTQFTNASTSEADPNDPTVNFSWDFDDTNTSTDEDPTHTFGAAQSYTVTLTVSYRDNACPASLDKVVNVQAAPVVQITNPDNDYSVCLGDDLKLEVLGNFNSFLWSTGETTGSIFVDAGGTYSVDVNAGGCVINKTKDIIEFPAAEPEATATPKDISVGDVVVLSATGLANYSWSPTDGVEFPNQAFTNATPPAGITYTVSGTDNNGCFGEASVTITLIGEGSIGLLKPEIYFSPNGDEFNPFWEVQNAPLLPQCSVTIFDELGIKVLDAKPYENDWDGTSTKGKKLPAGVYFYIIRCDDSDKILKGSINLIR